MARDFAGRRVLDGVSFALAAGERIAILGPNGSGKTTLLRCLAGALSPTAGTVRVGGGDPQRAETRTRLGAALGDQRSFYLRLSAHENLVLFARLKLRRWGVAAEVEELERELDLAEMRDRAVARCSSGMVQRLALARALVGAPALLVLDEPTRSMDDAAKELAWQALERRPRLALALATHDPAEAGRCGARLELG